MMFDEACQLKVLMYLVNSQKAPSTPDEEEVVTPLMVPAASEGTTSPQGIWIGVAPSAPKKSLPFESTTRIVRPLRSSTVLIGFGAKTACPGHGTM